MSNNILSTFKTNWVVKSIPFNIQYRKASSTTDIDKILCTILKEKDGNISYNKLALLLGFNISTQDEIIRYGDPAENKIFENYLNGLEVFHLIESQNNIISITSAGLNSLETGLKYKYYAARTTVLENITADEDDHVLFSFRDAFSLKSYLTAVCEIKPIILSNNDSFLDKINFQLFENDKFEGEALNFKKLESKEIFKELEINTYLVLDKSQTKSIKFEHFNKESTSLNNLVLQDGNSDLFNALIRKGEFHHHLNLNKVIDSKIIIKYLDLWDWSKLVENPNVEWQDKQVFEILSQNGDKGTWRVLSAILSPEILIENLTDYIYFWDWSVLSEKINEIFIKESVSKYPWDFEILSGKDSRFVIDLLQNKEVSQENWDWSFLSVELPESFIKENIERYTWDYFRITQTRFEIFKDVFNESFKTGSYSALGFLWDWHYISKNINLKTVYKHLEVFASYIDWQIVLKRFFTEKEIIATFIADTPFQEKLKNLLPISFRITTQEYFFTKELVSILDHLDLIVWETEVFLQGFDTNKSIIWDHDFFEAFQDKIKTEEGFKNVSTKILDANSIFLHSSFSWDWDIISANNTITSNTKFISYVLKNDIELSQKINWKLVFKNHDIAFWNFHLDNIQNKISFTENLEFFTLLTESQTFDVILKNPKLKWDFDYLSRNITVDEILNSLEDERIRNLWDWEIITPRIDKPKIYSMIDKLNEYVNWPFIINKVFNIETDLSLETNLEKIAFSLGNLTKEKNAAAWMALTNRYPIETLFSYIEKTKDIDHFNWNWDAISSNRYLKVDLVSINHLKSQLNWEIFSGNEAINKIFDPEEGWSSFKEYIQYAQKYLDYFIDSWNWRILSTNPALNWNRSILSKYIKQDWDWSYLSEHGKFLRKSKKDSNNYLTKLLAKFTKIDLELVSARTDIEIDNSTLINTQELNWNWTALSNNPIVKIDGNTLIQLHQKSWDWEKLSSRDDLKISNELVTELKNKLWNWSLLSSSPELRFDQEFLTDLIDKPWDWNQLSRHNSFIPTQSLLHKLKRFDLDWDSISRHVDLPINRETLLSFKEKLNWYSVTRHNNFDITNLDLVDEFKEYLDWTYMSGQDEFSFSSLDLDKFENYLDWDLLSSNSGIQFNESLINKFETKWNWNKLTSNNRVKESLSDFINNKVNGSPIIKFLSKIDLQDSDYKNNIYHFTHIENAIEIIKNKKIQSRDRANILGDAAGNVVHLRGDAHSYARFYFRPHTPTQFYNEFLGTRVDSGYENKEGDWVSWYEKSRGLSFPKCPIPIFFKFSLKEVVYDKNLSNCISNGNMQTKSTRFGSIGKMFSNFDFQNLYFTPERFAKKSDYRKYREASQQEFLVEDELNFNNYKSFEIICATDSDKSLLKIMLGKEYQDIFSKIKVDSTYYNFDNTRVDVRFSDDNLIVDSDFIGDGFFSIETHKKIDKTLISAGDVIIVMDSEIQFKSRISLSNFNEEFKIQFVDESGRKWLIFKTE